MCRKLVRLLPGALVIVAAAVPSLVESAQVSPLPINGGTEQVTFTGDQADLFDMARGVPSSNWHAPRP